MATLTPPQRRRLQAAYRDALNVKHRVDEHLVMTHILHFRQLSTAVRRLKALTHVSRYEMERYMILVFHQLFSTAHDMLESIIYYYDPYTKLAHARDALMKLLIRQRENVWNVIQSNWHLPQNDASAKMELTLEMASATRVVITAMPNMQFVEPAIHASRTSWNASKPVIGVLDERCKTSDKAWTRASVELLKYAQQLTRALLYDDIHNTSLWATSIQRLRDFWMTSARENHQEICKCVVELDNFVKIVSRNEQRIRDYYYRHKRTDWPETKYTTTFAQFLASPLVDEGHEKIFDNGTIDILELLTLMQNATEYTSIFNLLHQLQIDVEYDMVGPIRRRVSVADDLLGADIDNMTYLFEDIYRYTWDRTSSLGAKLKQFRTTMDDISLWASGVRQSLVKPTNVVLQIIQRYKTFLQHNVTREDMNQEFVRWVITVSVIPQCYTPVIFIIIIIRKQSPH